VSIVAFQAAEAVCSSERVLETEVQSVYSESYTRLNAVSSCRFSLVTS